MEDEINLVPEIGDVEKDIDKEIKKEKQRLTNLREDEKELENSKKTIYTKQEKIQTLEQERKRIEAKEKKEKKILEKEKKKISEIKKDLGEDPEINREIIEKRGKEIISFLKKKASWIFYVVLAGIVAMSVYIRTLPMRIDSTTGKPGLWDVARDSWTLGPDLDPFLFLRWAKYIVAKGSLMVHDTMRYVPEGYNTKGELILHPYLMAWFHKIASFFGSTSVEYSAILYPVVMFAFTVIAFFLLTRKIFIKNLGETKSNIIALISTFFLSILPSLLPRTIAGIPEKESAAFLFLFLTLYFFLCAWDSGKYKSQITFSILAGLSTAAMALIWGGYGYIFLILSVSILIAFILGKINKRRAFVYGIWILTAFIFMMPFSTRYEIKDLLSSITTGSSVLLLVIIFLHMFLMKTKIKQYYKKYFPSIPPQIISLIGVTIILLILATIVFGISFVPTQIKLVYHNLVRPATSRLIVTVAENRQPYFTDWAFNFGPNIPKVPAAFSPLLFILFFIGSIALFTYMIRKTFSKKDRYLLTIAYSYFLLAITYSRYKSNSLFNGTNFASIMFLFSGFLVLIISLGYYYIKYYKDGKFENFKNINFSLIVLMAFFILGIISARGLVRLIMMLVPSASILACFLAVMMFNVALKKSKKEKGESLFLYWIATAVIIILLFVVAFGVPGVMHGYYQTTLYSAKNHVPSVYHQQWQYAMDWVRENTPENAVFGHWWDYGYWLQSIGERATVLDGGNAVGYWNHLMGRHGLTSPNINDSLEFLYAHGTTHFLIDSTDIGKYAAFSSIGSDVNYDRASFIPTLLKDNSQTLEKKNSTTFIYRGGYGIDQDIEYEENNSIIFLAKEKTSLGGIIIERDDNGDISKNPYAVFISQNQQNRIPLRYAYDKGELIDFESGLNAGVYIFPRLIQSDAGTQINIDGALLYLSERTSQSQLARLYLYGEEEYFELAHSEDDYLVKQLKNQYPDIGDTVYFGQFRGPLKIWEINYPDDIQLNEAYLSTEYPEEISIAR